MSIRTNLTDQQLSELTGAAGISGNPIPFFECEEDNGDGWRTLYNRDEFECELGYVELIASDDGYSVTVNHPETGTWQSSYEGDDFAEAWAVYERQTAQADETRGDRYVERYLVTDRAGIDMDGETFCTLEEARGAMWDGSEVYRLVYDTEGTYAEGDWGEEVSCEKV